MKTTSTRAGLGGDEELGFPSPAESVGGGFFFFFVPFFLSFAVFLNKVIFRLESNINRLYSVVHQKKFGGFEFLSPSTKRHLTFDGRRKC